MSSSDAIEFMLAGASAIQVGTASFINPDISVRIVGGIEDYLNRKGFNDVKDIIGLINKESSF